MEDLTIGIVGCGRMGLERARSSAACGARIAIVYDTDESRATSLAAQYPGCRVATTPIDLMRNSPRALFVCSPPSCRGSIELAAIDAGVSFLAEKPIGLSANGVRPVLEALRARPVINAVGYQSRSRSSVQRARRCLDGRQVLAISAFWVGRKYNVPWWLRREDSGGPFNEQATHLVDLCRYLCGEITEVGSVIGSANLGNQELLTAAVTMRFASGTFGSLVYSCEANEKQIGVRVITAGGSLTLSSWDLALTANDISPADVVTAPEDVFVEDTRRFLDAVRTRNPAIVGCTYEDAWRSQQAVDRILEFREP